MAFRVALRQRHVLPLAAGSLAAAATVFSQTRTAYAEEPADSIRALRKPIYDDPTPSYPATKQTPKPITAAKGSIVGSADKAQNDTATASDAPTAIDRLAARIHDARLVAHGYSASAESSLNDFMTRVLHLENDFTSTIASLAPLPQVNEPLMPGFIYTLVATLAGSIVSRNRGIILRTSVPAAFGLTAAYAALPYTMHNVEELVSRYEERFPEVQRVHGEVSEKVKYYWETGKAHTIMTVEKGGGALEEARRKMQDWVRQGK